MAAAKKPKTAIEVGVNEQPAAEGLKRLARDFGSASIQINQALEVVSKAWGVVSTAVSGTLAVMDEYISLAAEQERVERRTIEAVRLKQDFSRVEFEQLQRANSARQRALGIGDEEQLALQGTLAAMGVRKELLDEATRATIGLAEVTGGSLSDASRVVAKVMAGEISALREYGIIVGSVAEAKSRLEGLYSLAETQSVTLTAKIDSLTAAWGDLGEQLGSIGNDSAEAKAGIDNLTSSVELLQDLIKDPIFAEAGDLLFGGMRSAAADALEAYIAYRELLIRDFSGTGQAAGVRFQALSVNADQLFAAGQLVNELTKLSSVGGLALFDVDELEDQFLRMVDGLDTEVANRDIDPFRSLLDKLRDGTSNAMFDGIEDGLARVSQGQGGGLSGLETRMGAPEGEIGGFTRQLARMRSRNQSRRRANDELFSKTIGGAGELPGLVPLTLETMFPGLEDQKQLAAKAAYELAQYQGEVLREAMAAERAIEIQDQEEYENHRVDLMVEARQRGIDLEANLSAQQLEQQIQAYDKQQEALQHHQEAVRQLYAQMIAQTAHAFGSMIGEMIAGKGDADAAMKELTAALGSTIGSFLIQMGTAAIASGIAASLLGTPAAVPAGIALVAAGAAFVALSSGLRASLRDAGDAGGVQAAASRSAPRFEDPFPRGFEAGPGFGGAQPQAANIVVNFNGIVDSRRAAREIRDVLGAA